MKNYTFQLLQFILLFSVCLIMSSCQKGEDIESNGYGTLSVSSTFESGSNPLLIKIDGETKDTLNTTNTARKMIVQAGRHKVSFVNTDDNKTLKDTSVTFTTGKELALPKFWYRKGVLLFDDYNPETMAKPATGNILARFITTSDLLPADMKVEIMVSYSISRNNFKVTTGKVLQHVTKTAFSEYVELPDPKTFVPANAITIYYSLDGYDNATGTKVMGPGAGSSSGPRINYTGVNSVWAYGLVSSNSINGLSTIFSKNL